MNIEDLYKFLDNLSSSEQISYIKDMAQELNKLKKRMEKASQKEFNEPIHCSRAKSTTLCANSYKVSVQYNRQAELLKNIVNYLL